MSNKQTSRSFTAVTSSKSGPKQTIIQDGIQPFEIKVSQFGQQDVSQNLHLDMSNMVVDQNAAEIVNHVVMHDDASIINGDATNQVIQEVTTS